MDSIGPRDIHLKNVLIGFFTFLRPRAFWKDSFLFIKPAIFVLFMLIDQWR